MTKRAERPITIAFTHNYRQNDPKFTCTFDSNDFVEFEILTHDLPMGEIVFKGNPFTDAGFTELGRCVFDWCDHGLYVFQELANMLYEAQHPWLDLNDALEKECLEIYKDYETIGILGGDYDYNIHSCEENKLPIVWTTFKDKVECLAMDNVLAFRPLASDIQAWVHCASVKVWQPPQ